jgi:type IV secretion system protein TrbL
MWILLLAVAGLWIVIHGLQLAVQKITIIDVAHDGIYVILATILLGGQGPDLVKTIYDAALGTMGAAASIALTVGGTDIAGQASVDQSSQVIGNGMVELVKQVEKGVRLVLGIAWDIASNAKLTSFLLSTLYALALAVPFVVLIVHYASQIMVSIFRIMMLTALSPFMMLGIGFGWGRDLAKGGIRSVIAAFMVLFASTGAVALVLYATTNLTGLEGATTRELTDVNDKHFWAYLLAVIVGWAGVAFLVEANGIANSLTGSLFTNTGAGMLTAGMLGTGAFLGKHTAGPAGSALKYLGSDPITNRIKETGVAKKASALIDRYRGVKK